MFSCMLRVKTDWRNRLANERLNHNLRISEEGVSISNYNPNDDIAKWYNEKVSNFKEQKYLKKQHKLSDGNSAVNTAAYVLSDFEESDDDEDDVEESET